MVRSTLPRARPRADVVDGDVVVIDVDATTTTSEMTNKMNANKEREDARAIPVAVVARDNDHDEHSDDMMDAIERALASPANVEKAREALKNASANTGDLGKELSGANAQEVGSKARRGTRARANESRAAFRNEFETFAKAMARAQVAPVVDDRSLESKTKETYARTFWSEQGQGKGGEARAGSSHAVAVSCRLNQYRFSRKHRARWIPESAVMTKKVQRRFIKGAKAVPSYTYFAYSTHSNSYDREDNFSRLLFPDDDGELLESDPIENNREEEADFSREDLFVLTAICALFSKPLMHAGPNEAHFEIIRKAVVDETAIVLKANPVHVDEWFKEAHKGGESTSRAWLAFRQFANRINKALHRAVQSSCIYTADLVAVLQVLDVDKHFWRGFARIIINEPTLAPRAQPVIHFDSFEEASEQLAGAFCPRCYVFDCRLHGSLQPKSVGRKLRTEERLKRKLSRPNVQTTVPFSRKNPCGPTCWFTTDEYKYYAESAATCLPCTPSERSPTKEDPYKTKRKEWKNIMDQQILVKAVEIIGKEAATPCEASLFFGTRRGCADVGRQMHLMAINAARTDAATDEEMKDAEAVTKNKRKRAVNSKSSQFKSSQHPTYRRRFKMGQKADTVWTQYTPCNCEGQCNKNTCTCAAEMNFCERYCNCGPSCWNEFDGCACKAGTCKTAACRCFAASRECDPDKCSRCCTAADAIMHPIRQKHGFVSSDVEKKMPALMCENMKLQLRQKEHVCLGRSDVAGWGSYILHGVRKGEFIGEYVGELISQNEADRRGRVYDQNNCSYLFNLNSEWVVDAQNRGNKLRFANHSLEANCHARILLVNGDNRLAIYASRDLAPGDELFYNYHYTDEVAPEWHDTDDGNGKRKGYAAKKSAKH